MEKARLVNGNVYCLNIRQQIYTEGATVLETIYG